jgi:UDP-N-acetyl-D-glucosamine dehydrogenase
MQSVPDLMPAVASADVVVIVTNHSSYDYSLICAAASLIVDTRNALGKIGKGTPKVVRL